MFTKSQKAKTSKKAANKFHLKKKIGLNLCDPWGNLHIISTDQLQVNSFFHEPKISLYIPIFFDLTSFQRVGYRLTLFSQVKNISIYTHTFPLGSDRLLSLGPIFLGLYSKVLFWIVLSPLYLFQTFCLKIDAFMVCLEIEFSNSYLWYYNFYVYESFVQVEQFSISLVTKAQVCQFDSGPLL